MQKEQERSVFKETMAENHPELMKNMNSQIQNRPNLKEDE